jgi:hypothetical protein
MIGLNREQLSAIRDSRVDKFAIESALFLEQKAPEWCRENSKEDKTVLVGSMIKLAGDCNLILEESVRQLMLYKIELDFTEPLTSLFRDKLSKSEMSETFRLEQFYQHVINKTELIKIAFDHDINAL